MVPEVWAAKGDTGRTITGLHLQGMGVEAVGARGGVGEVGEDGSLRLVRLNGTTINPLTGC